MSGWLRTLRISSTSTGNRCERRFAKSSLESKFGFTVAPSAPAVCEHSAIGAPGGGPRGRRRAEPEPAEPSRARTLGGGGDEQPGGIPDPSAPRLPPP